MADTRFKKGLVPWNKGKHTNIKHNKQFKKGQIPWNKGKKLPQMSGEYHPMFGKHHSEESIKKMRESKKGKMVGENNPFYGKHHSEETRKKISEVHKGKPSGRKGIKTGKPSWNRGISPSQETIQKQKETMKRTLSNPEVRARLREAHKHHSEESRKKQKETWRKTWLSNPELRKRASESHIEYFKKFPEARRELSESHKGQPAWNKGKKHTSESILKMSEAHKKSVANPEVIKRMREAQKKRYEEGEIPWNKGKKMEKPVWNKGKKMPELSKWGRKNILRQYESGDFPHSENTKPERQIKEELIKRGYNEGIDFIHQYKFMNKFMCDFCFPQQKIIIEVDGDFWHANPKKYPAGSHLHQHQIKGIGRDKSKSAYITKVDNGAWTLLRFWESDIKKDVTKCVDKIEEVLVKKKI
ncbi:MAG: NUMOD3 domain-containing DNA-binding protein [Nanoarchaeota archaeon]